MGEKEKGLMEKIVSLCKRRGFIFQSSEIYGGLSSCWDYGPLGVELKKNIKDFWWHHVVISREDVVGMDSAIFMHPKVWEASGHVKHFHDPLIDCKNCKARFREDSGIFYFRCRECGYGFKIKDKKIVPEDDYMDKVGILDLSGEPGHYKGADCPVCGAKCSLYLEKLTCPECGSDNLSKPRMFNLMFKTFFGPSEDSASIVYLRPETAQGIFVNFDNVITTSRMKLPFGIAQVGKAFRNEITTGNFIFRSREFEQMELEFFVKPDDSIKWYEYWINDRLQWYIDMGIRAENLRLRPHEKDELAHYARACTDIEYKFPFGWSELEGIADRQTYDLDQHIKFSGKTLAYYETETKKHIVPAVVESSAGVDRTFLVAILDAYWEDKKYDRVVLRLNPKIAPIKVAIFPLVNRDGMPEIARKIYEDIKKHMSAFYDQGGSIGRRYRRQDEAGTPFCVTVDSQTLEDQTVTIRDRDTLKQIRVSIDKIIDSIKEGIDKGSL